MLHPIFLRAIFQYSIVVILLILLCESKLMWDLNLICVCASSFQIHFDGLTLRWMFAHIWSRNCTQILRFQLFFFLAKSHWLKIDQRSQYLFYDFEFFIPMIIFHRFFFSLALPLNFKNIGYLGAMSKILGIFRKHLLNSSNTYVRPTGWLFVKPETNAVDLVFFFAPDRAPPFPHICKICTMLLFKSNP